jgi:hypothetical protein
MCGLTLSVFILITESEISKRKKRVKKEKYFSTTYTVEINISIIQITSAKVM